MPRWLWLSLWCPQWLHHFTFPPASVCTGSNLHTLPYFLRLDDSSLRLLS